MRQSPARHRSFGSVARAALAHPEWPGESRANERSLAALLSKLDRGVELPWLADRPRVLGVLAEVLGAPRSVLSEAVGPRTVGEGGPQPRLRLHDLPFASTLDLTVEQLPPVLPGAVLHPEAWSSLWWVAPSGSGRSLLGTWLEAHQRAAFVAGASWPDVAPRIPSKGPAFVELWADGPRAVLPPRSGICVAAPFAPSPKSREAWTIVSSPPPGAWIEALVQWVAARLPRDGHFSPREASEWLREAISEGAIGGFSEALGLAGLLDQYGAREIRRAGMDAIAKRFVRDRLASPDGRQPSDPGLLEAGVEALLGIAQRLLTDPGGAWDAPRAREGWARLVPREHVESVDSEWVRRALSRASSPPTVREIERALQDLPPGAFRIVRSLEQAGLLRRSAHSDRLSLAPRWLARRLVGAARSRLVRASPRDWGEALLHPDSAGPVAREVVARALGGDLGIVEEALDAEDGDDPACVAALEMAARAAGLAALLGIEVPDDVALALWDQTASLAVERSDGAQPRIAYSEAVALSEVLLDAGTFQLAALSLSEGLPGHRGTPHAALRPWQGPLGEQRLMRILDAIWQVVRRANPEDAPWANEAFALAHRLVARARGGAGADTGASGGTPSSALPGHPLAWPFSVLEAIVEGRLSSRDLGGAHPRGVDALLWAAQRRGMEPGEVAAALWQAWVREPAALGDGSPLSPTAPHAERFYSHAPPSVLEVLFGLRMVDKRRVPYACFDEAAWLGVFSAGGDALLDAPEAWQAMPERLLRAALRSVTPAAADLAVVWARAPQVALDALDEAFAESEQRAASLLDAAPASCTASIASRLTARLVTPSGLRRDARRLARAWLHQRVLERSEGWRQAFTLLGTMPAA